MKRHLVNALTVALTICIVFYSLVLFFYLYPRNIVEADTPRTTQDSYRVGDEVFVKGHTHIFVTGSDVNDVRLQCGDSMYFIKQVSLSIKPLDTDYLFSLGAIPDGVMTSPPKCKFVTRTTYTVKTFLWFTRQYTHEFVTNEFNIIK